MKYVYAASLTRGCRIAFDSDKTYIVKSAVCTKPHARLSLSVIEFRLFPEGEDPKNDFKATYYAGDQIRLIEKCEFPHIA